MVTKNSITERFMKSRKVIVHNEHGIHARVALRVLEASRESSSNVTIFKGRNKADGCSIMDLLLLGATQGSEIELLVDGGDEEKSISALSEIFEDGAGI